MAIIEVKHLHKVFGDLEVLKDISFNVEEGEVICLILDRPVPENPPCSDA